MSENQSLTKLFLKLEEQKVIKKNEKRNLLFVPFLASLIIFAITYNFGIKETVLLTQKEIDSKVEHAINFSMEKWDYNFMSIADYEAAVKVCATENESTFWVYEGSSNTKKIKISLVCDFQNTDDKETIRLNKISVVKITD